jgi:predicted phosphodiesterase
MWTAAVRYIEKSRPDLVIHTGDVVHDDPDSDRDHEFAAFQMRRLTTPWRIVPGNHDIGDSEPDPFRGLPPSINSLDENLYVNKSIGLKSRGRLLALVESGAVKLIGSGHLHEHVVLFSGGALLVGAPALGPVPVGDAAWHLGLRCNGLVEYRFSGAAVRVRLLRETDLGIHNEF